MANKKKHFSEKKIDTAKLKQELTADLDEFLLEEGDLTTRKSGREKALAELDKLIRQDLPYAEILSTIKQETKTSQPAVRAKTTNHSDPQHSSYVLDLKDRPRVEKSKPDKNSPVWWSKIKPTRKSTPPQSMSKAAIDEFSTPDLPAIKRHFVWPEWSSRTLVSRLLVFIVILFLVLLPIRGLSLFGKFLGDKDKILGLGKNGLLDLQAGVISASGNSYESAQANFEEALKNFQDARDILGNYNQWLVKTAGLMPIVGKPLSLSQDMLVVATNISEAATILNQKLQTQSNPTQYLAVIDKQINQTLPYLEDANKKLEGISTALLPEQLRPYFNSLKIYLPKTVENLHNLDEMFDTLSEFLGHNSEKRYLVLFQNNNELRPTGGFIGSFALIDLYQGKIIGMEIPQGGTYDLSAGQKIKIKAPEALSRINPNFNIWDANWWYDFPTSAKKITDFYQTSGGSSVDGVVAINAQVLKELLVVTGPITLDKYNLTISSDNLYNRLQEEVELNYDKEANAPKAVIADLVPVVLEKILANTEKQKDIVSVFAKSLSSKDIQIYSKQEDIEAKIDNFGWSGKALDNDRDYLAVVNTNIGGGKTDNDVYQEIDHRAEISASGEIVNTVRLTRTNQGSVDNPFAGTGGSNTSYIRFYIPQGSQFLEGLGFDTVPDSYFIEDTGAKEDADIAREEKNKMTDASSAVEIYSSLDKDVLGGWLTIGPGETKTVLVKYKLPFKLDLKDPLVNNWRDKLFTGGWKLDNYSLLVQSQSGQQNSIFNSSVILPDKAKVIWNNASDKQNMNVVDNLVTYNQILNRDHYFGFILATK